MTKLQLFTMNDWQSQVLSEEKPVLVDFQAPWCQPLLLQEEALMKLSGELRAEAKVYKVDITLFPAVAMTYRLIDFPTLSLFNKGEHLKSYLGIGRIREMKNILKTYINSYVRS